MIGWNGFGQNDMRRRFVKILTDDLLCLVNGTRYSEGGASASFLTDTEVSGVSAHRGGAVNSSNQGTAATYVNGVDNGSVHMERELTPWCPEGTDANNCDDELFDTLDDHVSQWFVFQGGRVPITATTVSNHAS